mmetsp:Transcript_30968/g.68614  ORF Transcript_30968/g.68614 Transcript_30968/m.68614 type:complete len:228 (-) Transcript_30968:1063-1746(-)
MSRMTQVKSSTLTVSSARAMTRFITASTSTCAASSTQNTISSRTSSPRRAPRPSALNCSNSAGRRTRCPLTSLSSFFSSASTEGVGFSWGFCMCPVVCLTATMSASGVTVPSQIFCMMLLTDSMSVSSASSIQNLTNSAVSSSVRKPLLPSSNWSSMPTRRSLLARSRRSRRLKSATVDAVSVLLLISTLMDCSYCSVRVRSSRMEGSCSSSDRSKFPAREGTSNVV